MLALLKKTAGSGAKEAGLPWRPDFRAAELLPDTKSVRTNFLVNTLVFSLLGGLLLFAVYREITISGLMTEVASLETEIAAAKGPSEKAVADFQLFQAEEKKLRDAQAVIAPHFSFPDFLIRLASLMPPGVKASRIEHRGIGQSILVSGSIEGLDAAASETATAFFSQLQQDTVFKEQFSSISNSNLGRNTAAGSLSFELIFTFSRSAGQKTR